MGIYEISDQHLMKRRTTPPPTTTPPINTFNGVIGTTALANLHQLL